MSPKARPAILAAGLVLSLAAPVVPAPQARGEFVIGELRAKPGETVSGYLPVPEKDGLGTRIPVTVIHGARPGKVLALVAGLHPFEYPPILALYRLKASLDAKDLAGTVLMVHIANLPG